MSCSINFGDHSAVKTHTVRSECGQTVQFSDRNSQETSYPLRYWAPASDLNELLNQLRRSFGREDTHGAIRMWANSPVLRSKFPRNKLSIAILGTSVRSE